MSLGTHPSLTRWASRLWIGLAFACNSPNEATNTRKPLPCARSLDDYCPGATPACVRHVDAQDELYSFCARVMAPVVVSLGNCPDGTTFVIVWGSNTWTLNWYDSRTDDLLEIVDENIDVNPPSSRCVAGPPAGITTSDMCQSGSSSIECAAGDSGMPDGIAPIDAPGS